MRTLDEINEFALNAIEHGVVPAELNIADLTGLKNEEITALTQKNTGHQYFYFGWQDRNFAKQMGGFSQTGDVFAGGPTSRKPLTRMLQPLAKLHGARYYLEISRRDLLTQPLLNATTNKERVLKIFIPSSAAQQTAKGQGQTLVHDKVELHDGKYEMVDAAYQKNILAHPDWKPLEIASYTAGPIGAYNENLSSVCVFIGASVNRNWAGWSKSKRMDTSEPALWQEIIEAALPKLPHVTHNQVKGVQVTPAMMKAYEMAAQWRQIRIGQDNPLINLRTDYANRIQNAEVVRDQSRTQIVNTQKELTDLKKKLHDARAHGQDRVRQALEIATTSVRHLQGLDAIKSVEPTTMDNQPALMVHLNDIVLKDETNDCQRLVPGLIFSTCLTGKNSYKLRFHQGVYKKDRIHPHIWNGGGHPCLGDAATMLQKAAALQDMIMLINVVIRWAANTKQYGTYREGLITFPKTTLKPGYHAGAWDAK